MLCRGDNQKAALLRHAWWSQSVALKLASGQVDPNDPNYDPDEDEPRRAPVALHAGHSEEMAAFKRAVQPQCTCSFIQTPCAQMTRPCLTAAGCFLL